MSAPGGPAGSSLPVVDGFRQRGVAMTRLETFTDAAFAFSLTLLVISFDALPGSFDEFIAALKNIPAFAGSFATISMFWYGHHVWSRRFGLDDLPTALLTLAFVFVMLIYVYPLRLVFSGLFAWLSDGWFPFMFDEFSSRQLTAIFVIYGTGFAAMSGLLALHYRHALRLAEDLALNVEERFIARSEIIAWLLVGGVGLASALWALSLPRQIAVYAGMVYLLLSVIMPVFARLRRRQWDTLERAAGEWGDGH